MKRVPASVIAPTVRLFGVTDNPSRIVHVMPIDGNVAVYLPDGVLALCGQRLRFRCIGEETRMPLCVRCARKQAVIDAAFDVECDDET